MTPLQEAQRAFYARRPWVMHWTALGGMHEAIRFAVEGKARKTSRIHNQRVEGGTWSQVTWDPAGERFPR